MKTSDQQQLEHLYERVLNKTIDEKVSWKGALAGAALGVSAMTGAHASEHSQMSPDDYADKAMISYVNSKEELTPHEAFNKTIEMIHANQKIPTQFIKIISTNEDLVKRCSYLMVMKGMKLPPQFTKIVGDLESKIKSSLIGP